MTSLALQVGGHLNYRDKVATIRTIESDFVVLEIDGKCNALPLSELYADMQNGLVETHKPSVLLVKASPLTTYEERAKAKKYQDYLTALDNEEFPSSNKVRSRVIERIAIERGDSGRNKPSAATLYRWYHRYTSDEINRNVAAMVTPSIRNRGRQASPEVLDLFFEVVSEHYLILTTEGALSKQQTYERFECRFEAFLASRPEKERDNIRGISRSVFYELINEIDPVEICVARDGQAAATMRFRHSTEHFITSRPLELVQIDAVHINIALRDIDGNYIGMPVVFFAIDVFTRAILGYVINYAQKRREDLCSAIDLIKCSVMPKQKPLHTKNSWPLYGKPELIQHDSGIFSSKQFKAFVVHAGMMLYQNPAKKAWFNAYIERFNSTFRQRCCQRIPGHLGKQNEDRKDSAKIETVAHTTIGEFQKIVEAYILDDYHQTSHRGVGTSPMDMCKGHTVTSIPTPEYVQRLNNFRGIEFKPTLNLITGIKKNTLFYNDKAGKLGKIFNFLTINRIGKNVTAFYSELDISKISVLDPETGELITVPCTSIKEPTSLAEYKARKRKSSGGRKTDNFMDSASPIIDGINARRAEEQKRKDEAKAKSKKDKSKVLEAELSMPLHPTDDTLNDMIERNRTGINLPPPVSENLSCTEHNLGDVSPYTRKKSVKPIKI